MTERPEPDIDRVREALRRHDERAPDEQPPAPGVPEVPEEEDEREEEDGTP